MTFQDAQARLLAHVRARICNGELTERSLASKLGISQPHINNVLKGRRSLSIEIGDLLLNYFHFSLEELFDKTNSRPVLVKGRPLAGAHEVELLRNLVGPGQEWSWVRLPERLRVPTSIADNTDNFVAARLIRDERMNGVLGGAELALVDTSVGVRLEPCRCRVFVVQCDDGPVLRWIRTVNGQLHTADEITLGEPHLWKPLRIGDEDILHYIKGQIVWVGADKSLPSALCPPMRASAGS